MAELAVDGYTVGLVERARGAVFFDVGDYPKRISEDVLYKLTAVYRERRPEFILTHARHDPYNFDHPLASQVAQEARIVAQAHGHEPSTPILGAPPAPVFLCVPMTVPIS